ncbi:glycerol-3-phosphate acyltransferase [Thermus filiformis]|uniref:Glycerol-3-phosphate acyltransferase n=1 Tax=Thermus filiformis TaxID=276 RepID=A0A0A2XC63_THEFI|nr:glycerol-3-phosphate acyltransferase [Thermus filiformis]KGQ22754.1 glycerol-3-phosphate acyltransferase [Thermus filiformis]
MGAAFLSGYLLGSLPFAFWFGALRGKNLLLEGSKNPGALNALRVLGAVPGLMVLVLDVFKGVLAVALGEFLAQDPAGGLLAGVGAVLGHAFSPWLLFRGGKAIAPGIGVLFAVDPRVLLGEVLLFGLLFLAFRHPYRAVLSAALALPLLTSLFGGTPAHLLFGLGVGLVVALKHLKDWTRAP